MNNTTLRYAKSVMQLEKGLPPNGVVPLLKDKVEEMREQVGDTDIYNLHLTNKAFYTYYQITHAHEIIFWKHIQIH